jgi:hypothetical protein
MHVRRLPPGFVRDTDLAGSVTRGEYRPLEGARHSTLTTDRPDDVVRADRAVRDLIGMAAS